MDLGLETLSKVTIFSKYAKYLSSEKRRETWDEIVDRYEEMMIRKYPTLKESIQTSAKFIRDKKVLPSMRALQFAGSAMEVNNSRGYNCAYLPIDSLHSFSETMFLLLGGTGVGYSVQKHHVAKLPVVIKQDAYKQRTYLIEDSIMGWADAVKVLMKFYFEGGFKPKFDFRAIRKKGARLITAGGKAPGPEPLKICLVHIDAIMERKNNGEPLTPLECHDILCHIANSVLAGGIRRSAMIALFSHDDEEMITCKYGNWWELNEQRGRANNSAVLKRGEIDKEEFDSLWKRIEASGSGEPGIYWSNDLEWGTNPCCFIGSTLVATADGRNAVTIKQLCDENYQGPVYSMQSQTGQVVTSYCSKVWKSRENAELVKVLLDDGSSFTCTPDHRIMLRNGQYVQAQYLVEGTSLMPFNSYKRSDRNYRMIQSNTGRDIAQYAHVAQCYDIIKEGYNSQHIHHKDGNGFNDLPENLEVIDAIEHNRQHMLGKNNAFHKMSNEVREQWSEKQSSRQKGENNTNSNGLTTEEMIMRCFDRTVQKRAKLSYQEVLDSCGVKFLSKGRLKEMKAETVGEFAEKLAELANHKVISVEFLSEREDVYDMTVEGTHNFAIITSSKDENFITSSGVFVHNCEIGLRPFQMCNLCEVNVSKITDQEDLNNSIAVASFFGTLQAGFTDFHYLRPIWKQTCDKDALLGIGMTGIGSGEILKYDLDIAAYVAKTTNAAISGIIGTNEAARITCIKPSGTTSCVLGTSSGIHAWHAPYYLRTMRFNKNEDIAAYLMVNHPELCEDDILRPNDTLCVRIPIKAPEGSIYRTETAIDTLERVKKFSQEWVKPGHISGANTHNVSATISIDKSRLYKSLSNTVINNFTDTVGEEHRDEWEVVGQWMWENRDVYNGLSVLPYFGGSYQQAPFEDISEEEYNKRIATLHSLDLTKVIEIDDNVEFSQVAACSGSQCEINL
jgi:intein/homing endonuclease